MAKSAFSTALFGSPAIARSLAFSSSGTARAKTPLSAPIAVCALAVAVGACAKTIPPPSMEVRRDMQSIAVVGLPPGPSVDAVTPARGSTEGALRGTGQGLLTGLAVAAGGAASGAVLLSVPLGAAVAVVGAPVGAIIGASTARSAQEVDESAKALREALADIRPEIAIGNALAERGAAGKTLISVPGPIESLPSLQARGIDTVLEIEVREYGFATSGRIDPDLRVAIVGNTRLLRVSDGAVLHARPWQYLGPSAGYFALAANGGAGAKSALLAAYSALAAEIAAHIFDAPASAGAPANPAPMPAAPTAPVVSSAAPPAGTPPCSAVGGFEHYRRTTGGTCRCDAMRTVWQPQLC